MRKRILTIALIALILMSVVLLGGCNGKLNMLTGRWKLATVGDGSGANQEQYPLPVIIDIYPDGRIDMLDTPFGKWTMDRDTYTFVSDDGTLNSAGSFKIEYVPDQNTGNNVPTLTVLDDTNTASYILTKQADLGPLQSYKRAQASASPKPAPAPTATATASK